MTEAKEASELSDVLRSVIEVLHDGHEGMMEIGKHLKDESTKLFFLRESQVRAEFAAELENELHRHGERDVNEGGTAAGAIHRVWGEAKAHLGGGDHTLLATAEQGEDAAKAAYAKALQKKLPGDVLDVLRTQQAHIVQSHNIVRDLRDAKAA
jgi:uncharacterized protein (TIGR02284 family)